MSEFASATVVREAIAAKEALVRLAGDEIHLHARLLAVADTYDAITSDRPYRLALPPEEAGRRIRGEAGAQFDPAAVDAFNSCEPELARVRKELLR